jgi:hypothetical protein
MIIAERIGCTFLQRNKNFDKFREFKAMVEKKSGQHIKVLRSYRGDGYDSIFFHDLCKKHRFKR